MAAAIRADGHRVRCLRPAAGARPNPLTVEGEIAAFGQFAQGAVHAHGWTGKLARLFIFWVLAVTALGLVLEIAVILR